MMNKFKFFPKSIVLLSLTLFISCVSNKKIFSDAKEYGFKGEIKRVITKHYEGLVKNENWIINDNSLVYITTMNFDNKGRIITVIDSSVTNRYNPFYRKYIYSHNGSKTTGYKVYDMKKKLIGSSIINWEDNYKYTAQAFFNDRNYSIDAYTLLNDNFSQKEGGYIIKQENNNTINKYYKRRYSKNGDASSTLRKDTITNNGKVIISSYEEIFEDNLYDSHHNLIKLASVNKKTGELIEFFTRTFEYY